MKPVYRRMCTLNRRMCAALWSSVVPRLRAVPAVASGGRDSRRTPNCKRFEGAQIVRTRQWLKLCVCTFGLLGAATAAHAEGGCPPGQYPANGQGWQACYPIPGYDQGQSQQNQAPPRWLDMWGAVATYIPSNGTEAVGTAINLPTRKQAEDAALQDCHAKGGVNCKIELSYSNQCAAMVVGRSGQNVNPGATINDAAQRGIAVCRNSGDTGCQVYYSACSLPRRIQ